MRTLGLAVIGVSSLLVLGCGNGSQNEGGVVDMAGADLTGASDLSVGDLTPVDLAIQDGINNVMYATVAEHVAEAICDRMIACGKLATANRPACVEQFKAPAGYDVDGEFAKGHIGFNEMQCRIAAGNSRCDGEDAYSVFTQACSLGLFEPKQPNATPCLADQECLQGYCQHIKTDAGVQPTGCSGTCTAFKPTDGVCTDDNQCNVLIAFCNITAGTTGACKPLPVSTACSLSVPCAVGYVCKDSYFDQAGSDGTGNGVGTCNLPTAGAASGQPCEPQQGIYTNVPPCAVATDYCAVLPGTGANAGKVAGFKAATVCKAKGAAGAACDPTTAPITDNACVDGYSCTSVDPANSTDTTTKCRARAAVDQFCVNTNDCQSQLFCDASVTPHKCKAKVADGQLCNTATNVPPCVSANCHANPDAGTVGGPGTCLPQLGFGAACTAATAQVCQGGTSCVANTCTNICQ
jgi:hypothetical protein